MAEQTKIQGPIEIQSDSGARVAFELMEKISHYDGVPKEQRDTKYWLGLYLKCWKATRGYSDA